MEKIFMQDKEGRYPYTLSFILEVFPTLTSASELEEMDITEQEAYLNYCRATRTAAKSLLCESDKAKTLDKQTLEDIVDIMEEAALKAYQKTSEGITQDISEHFREYREEALEREGKLKAAEMVRQISPFSTVFYIDNAREVLFYVCYNEAEEDYNSTDRISYNVVDVTGFLVEVLGVSLKEYMKTHSYTDLEQLISKALWNFDTAEESVIVKEIGIA